jgi:hypothetical protein
VVALCRRAELHQHRAEHADVEHLRQRGGGAIGFVEQDQAFHRAEVGAAGAGQCGAAQPRSLRMRCQATVSCLRGGWPARRRSRISGQLFADEGAHLVTEGALFGGEVKSMANHLMVQPMNMQYCRTLKDLS